jgi:hypothetical protein
MLHFTNGKIIDCFNFSELSMPQKQQFLIAGKLAWGKNPSLFKILKKSQSEQMKWELFQVYKTENEKVLYDVWILGDDSGTVFYSNTPKELGVEMSQSYFDSVLSDDAISLLANQIGEAFKEAKKSFSDEKGEYDSNSFQKYWDEFYKKLDMSPLNESDWDNIEKEIIKHNPQVFSREFF